MVPIRWHGGLFVQDKSRFRPGFLNTLAIYTQVCYAPVVHKKIKSSGQGAIPYRWYSPRAARHDSVKLRSRQYSLDGRR